MLVLLLLISLISIPLVKSDSLSYRLPENQLPSKYSIALKAGKEIFDGTSTEFTGTVDITFTVTEITNQILFNSKVAIKTLELRSTGGVIPHSNITSNDAVEITTIFLDVYLSASTEYTLHIEYTGQVDGTNMEGFYRSSYKSQSGETQYLVTTQLHAINARRVFPCFDEPRYKAKFALKLTYPRGLAAISNTPVNGAPAFLDEEYEEATFIETPAMSTYLLAFTVSKFICSSGENIGQNIPHRVCSRSGTESERALALEYGTKILNTLGEYLGISYSEMTIGKIDQLAIPDFSGGAMENWGMVTYKELALLYNSSESSEIYKQGVTSTVAHELSHMWFGDLVSIELWDYAFLSEGFARYFQYFIQTKIPELVVLEMDKQFVVEVQQSVYQIDASNTSNSLTSVAESPAEIEGKFGKISYHKGASIIKMVESLIAGNFSQALLAYLQAKKFSSAEPNDLWTILSTYVPAENLPSNTNFTSVMENWTNKAGYPLVTVTVEGTNIILTQERFLYQGSDDTRWYIPVTYTIFNEDNIATKTVTTWLLPGEEKTIISNVLSNNSWVIVNTKSSGYFRVHYDSTIWNRIALVLQNNRRAIDNVTRSQIIDDILNLARARKVSYTDAFQQLDFLENETCYYPWYSAIEGFNYLLMRFGEQSMVGKLMKNRILKVMGVVKTNITFDSVSDSNPMYSLKVEKILSTSCRLGDEYCKSKSLELYRNYTTGTSIDKNLRKVVYCNALRYSTDIETEWYFLWNRLQTTSQANEIHNIITSLGCTTNVKLLKFYLEQSVNSSSGIRIQNLPDLWASVYTSSTEGVDVSFSVLTENYESIRKYYAKSLNLLPAIVDRFSSKEQIKTLETFTKKQEENSTIRLECEKLLITARSNLEWVASVQSDLYAYFGIVSASPAIGSGILIFTIIPAILIMKIVI